jgi:hypothetical protein
MAVRPVITDRRDGLECIIHNLQQSSTRRGWRLATLQTGDQVTRGGGFGTSIRAEMHRSPYPRACGRAKATGATASARGVVVSGLHVAQDWAHKGPPIWQSAQAVIAPGVSCIAESCAAIPAPVGVAPVDAPATTNTAMHIDKISRGIMRPVAVI